MGVPKTLVTSNHPYYVRKMYKKYNSSTQTNTRFFADAEWKNVSDLEKGDYIGIAINQNSVIPQ